MYYDLNVPAGKNLEARLQLLSELGYGAVAVNYSVQGRLPVDLAPQLPEAAFPKLRVYSRVTITLSDDRQNPLPSSPSSPFDIVAVRPTSERTFASACQSLDADIISLDLDPLQTSSSSRLPFQLKHGLVREAVQRGVLFELCYGHSIVVRDPGRKRQVLANAMNVVRILGKGGLRKGGLFVSSGVEEPYALRAPSNVRAWIEMIGVGSDCSKLAVVDSPAAAAKHAGERKFSVRGAVVKLPADDGKAKGSCLLEDYIASFTE